MSNGSLKFWVVLCDVCKCIVLDAHLKTQRGSKMPPRETKRVTKFCDSFLLTVLTVYPELTPGKQYVTF